MVAWTAEEDFIHKMIQLSVMTVPLVMFARVRQVQELQWTQLKEVTNVQSASTVPRAALGLNNALLVLTQNTQELQVFKSVCPVK